MNEQELDDYGMPIAPTARTTRPEPSALAERSLARNKDGGIKLRGLAKSIDDYTHGDSDQIRELIDQVEAAANKTVELGSPLTRKLVNHTKTAYEHAVDFLSQNSVENHWIYDVVKHYAVRFLELRARVAKGKGGGRVKAQTVLGWYSCLIICIVKYTHDPITGFKMGGKLLYKERFADDMLAHVKQISQTLKLDRHTSKKKICGLEETRIMIEHLIKSSVLRCRLSRLQLIAVMIICLATGLRPSSFCAGCEEDEELGKFMKMGDFKLYNRGNFAIDIELTVNNSKNHNATILGSSMNFWLRALTKTHNIIFDTFWIVAFIWARGCLANYPTPHDLLTTKDAELVITSPDEPFLLVPNKGATKLLMKPWTAKGLSAAISGVGKACGLGVTQYSFRRNFANKAGIALGGQEASMAMGHQEGQTVLSTNYSHGAGNYDLLGIMVGEATEQYRPGTETALQMRVRVGTAVVTLSKAIAQSNRMDYDLADSDSDSDSPEPEDNNGVVDVDKALKREDEELQQHEKRMEIQWTLYLDTFGRGSPLYEAVKGYKRTQISILGKITKHNLYQKAAKDPKFLARVEPAEKALRDANVLYRKCIQATRKRGKTEGAKALEQKKKENVASIQDTDASLAYLKEPSTLLTEASKTASTSKSTSAPGPSRTTANASNLSATEQTIEALSRDEDEDQDEIEEVYQNLQGFKQNNLAGQKHIDAVKEAADGVPEEGDSDEGEWKDHDEPERIPLASAYDMRVSLTSLALDPILFEREMQAQIEADDGKILCQKCRVYCDEDEEPHNFSSLSHLKRHMWQQHTEWSELVLKMKYQDRFMCPGCCGSQQQFDSIDEVYEHCLSDDCPDNVAFEMMKADHDANHERRYKVQKDYEQEGGNAKHRTVHHRKYLEYLRELTEDDLLDLADEYEFDRAEVLPHVALMLRNIHFVAEQ
ncbi:unnamed protein product [Rhizoctonia solani]|uniref:Uncharacterized protein n=1 Tax=Rhizoctonia solani TaxID=456999 RepID=A0A8H3AX41_9AGAM|nr:unnamed protein product [Rhizoctonia solani]